jgi:hypothetical protein
VNLPPYAPEATCPKCGHDQSTVRYSNGRSSWSGGCYGCPQEGRSEHLDRRCERCCYRWAEAVIAPAEQARDGREDGGDGHGQ